MAPDLGVVAVADGMGGKYGGAQASKAAVAEVERAIATDTSRRIATQYFDSPDLETRRLVLARLSRVMERAHRRLRELGKNAVEPFEMGTTLDVAWFIRDEVFLGHVGDGRVYVVRSNAALQLTEDHSEPATSPGIPDPKRSRGHPIARLNNAIGLDARLSVDTLMLELRRGDRLVLVTDGVWGALSSEAQLDRLVRGFDAVHAANGLVEIARSTSFDDRTALVVEVQGRFARHHTGESDVMPRDLGPVAESALFVGLAWSKILAALTIAVHVDFAENQELPHRVASDRGTYVLLDGLVRSADGKHMGTGATIYAECLVGCEPQNGTYVAIEPTRAIRIRRDDFCEICAADSDLAAELYRRLAEHLGRLLMR